jgi:predicted ATPase/DNA-binding SARP family transcriptional activator
MIVEVLGPVRALDDTGRDVTPAGPLQRRLLALLVLRRGHVVGADAAIAALWPDDLPDDPTAALQNHTSRLRRALPTGVVESVVDGYRIDPLAVDVDVDRLAGMVASPDARPADLAAVLARWHGSAYPELDDVDDVRAEVAKLEELRSRARERLAELRLAAGDTDGLVADLRSLADDEPLRERPRHLLMEALVADGRHAEALRVYDDFRRQLGAELGIEPSPSLNALQTSVLNGTSTAEWAPASNLPAPATSLVGRDVLLAEAGALVADHRLVTLVGPGGVGKTRAAIELGHRLLAERPDRPVVLCELALADATSTVEVVAATVGVDPRPGTPLVDRLVHALRGLDLVLVLDNCEHVLDPAAALAERLIAACPRVRLLATSRERLRIAGERVCTVPTLATTDVAGPAVELFVERAGAVVGEFRPDARQLACIADIVRRLDGLPLAIELAAARLHTHTVDEIAQGLGRRFALLSSGYRTSARHGSLGAAIAWSFDLLTPELRRLLTDVSVFAGPFSRADAAAVGDLAEADAEVALAQLVERSLVMRSPGSRYVLLETLKAFGAEQLAAEGRTDTAAGRHALRMVDFVTDADQRIAEPGSDALRDIDAALPELRLALDWLLAHDDVASAGRMIAGLLDYGLLRLGPDVLAWSHRVVAADPADSAPFAADVWVGASYATWMNGDVPGSRECAERAVRVAERTGRVTPRVPGAMANVELIDGRLAESAEWCRRTALAADVTHERSERVLALGTLLLALAYAGDPSVVALAEDLLMEFDGEETPYGAYLWYCAGEAVLEHDRALARRRLVRALAIAERTGAAFVAGVAGASRTSIDARHGDPHAAADDYRRLIVDFRRAGMWSTQWTMLRSIASLLVRLGRDWEATVLLGAIFATEEGHRIFGSDAVTLDQLIAQLRTSLGDTAFDASWRAGARLDGEAAVEHALRSL